LQHFYNLPCDGYRAAPRRISRIRRDGHTDCVVIFGQNLEPRVMARLVNLHGVTALTLNVSV
jgi:hypothetical protein